MVSSRCQNVQTLFPDISRCRMLLFWKIPNHLFERSKPLRDLELRLKPMLSSCPVWQVKTTGSDSQLAKTKLDLGLILRTGFETETRFSNFFK